MKYTILYMAGAGPWNLFMTVLWLPLLLGCSPLRASLHSRGAGLEVQGDVFFSLVREAETPRTYSPSVLII